MFAKNVATKFYLQNITTENIFKTNSFTVYMLRNFAKFATKSMEMIYCQGEAMMLESRMAINFKRFGQVK